MALPRRAAHGTTYLGLMFIVALLAMTAAMASVLWSTAQRRENERQLLFAGSQLAAAIESRHRRPGGHGSYPRKLEDLLGDAQRRDLRQVYVDPMTGSREWGLIRLPDSSIVGVYSLSNAKPFQQTRFVGAKSYREWRFVAPSAGEVDVEVRPPSAIDGAPPSTFASEPAARSSVDRPPAR